MSCDELQGQHRVIVGRLRAVGCVFAEDEADVLIEAATTPAELDAMVARRVEGVPLEVVVGWAEFCGLRIVIEPGVFVPRRRTEFLAALAISGLRDSAKLRDGAVVVDMCCGSGAVAASILAAADGFEAEGTSAEGASARIEVHASDIEPAAVRCARRNIGARGHVYQGDLFDPLPPRLCGRVDVLVANAPYVPTDAITLMPPEARDHEPLVTLDGGADGLDVLRRVIAATPQWLAAGGTVLVETSERQAPALVLAMTEAALVARVHTDDDVGATVVVGTC